VGENWGLGLVSRLELLIFADRRSSLIGRCTDIVTAVCLCSTTQVNVQFDAVHYFVFISKLLNTQTLHIALFLIVK